jgi:hypothetical protein
LGARKLDAVWLTDIEHRALVARRSPPSSWSLGAGDMDFAAPVLALPLGVTLSEILAAFSVLNEPLVTERDLQHRLFAGVECLLRDGAHLGGPMAPLLCIVPCG